MKTGSFEEHAARAMAAFRARDAESKTLLVNAVGPKVERVLDLGCGAGQELIAFLENTDAVCFGVDYGEELGKVSKAMFADEPRAVFVRAKGEELPFGPNFFDVVLCRVSLPYMNNRRAIAEIGRVLRPGGKLLLKTHSPWFYFWMIGDRLKSVSPKAVAYPVICLAAGIWHSLTGRQLQSGFWRGKEIYQTTGFIRREFDSNGLEITERLADDNVRTPSFAAVKRAGLGVIFAMQSAAALFFD